MKKLITIVAIITAIALNTKASFAEDKLPATKIQPTAKEFCIGRKTDENMIKEVVSFACETDGKPVPVFLAAMRTLCNECFTTLQDLVVSTQKPGDKPVSVDDLQRLMMDRRYDRLLVAKNLYNFILKDISAGMKNNEPVSDGTSTILKTIKGGDDCKDNPQSHTEKHNTQKSNRKAAEKKAMKKVAELQRLFYLSMYCNNLMTIAAHDSECDHLFDTPLLDKKK